VDALLALAAVVLGPPAVVLVLRRSRVRWFPGIALGLIAIALLWTLPPSDHTESAFVSSSIGLQLFAALLWAGYALIALFGALMVRPAPRRERIELAFAQSLSSARKAK
jgi:hypothetical protein